MKYIIPLLFLPFFSQAQTFYVAGKDNRSREHVEQKIRYEGYQVVDSAKADFIVQMLIDGTYKVVSFKRPYSGYISIIKVGTGEEIVRTKEVKRHPAALNGYNAAWSIFTIISKRYLPDALKKCKTKS